MSRARSVRPLGVLLAGAVVPSLLISWLCFRILASRYPAGTDLASRLITSAASYLLVVLFAAAAVFLMSTAVFEQISKGIAQVRSGGYPRLLATASAPFSRYLQEFNGMVEELRARNEKQDQWTRRRQDEAARATSAQGTSQGTRGADTPPASPEGYLLVDAGCRAVAVDGATAEVLGMAADEISGQPLERLIAQLPARSRRSQLEEQYGLLSSGKVNAITLLLNGARQSRLRISRLPFRMESAASPAANGSQGAGEQDKVEKLKSEFVATISHELRTPLTSIKGALTLIRSGGGGHIPLEAMELLDIALSNTERLVTSINNVLDVGLLEHRGVTLQRRPVSIDAAVERALELVNQQAADRKITIQVSLPSPHPVFSADMERMVQVLANLLSNAIKFSPEHSRVLLAARVQEKLLTITVQDFGKGMSPAFLSRLFHKFEHEQDALTRQTQGCGLGLAICKLTVDAHGGRIWAESKENEGSTFYLTLPLSAGVQNASNGVVLVVDEDDDLKGAMEAACAERGLRLVSCHSSKDVARLVRYYHPIVVVLDEMARPEELVHILRYLEDDESTRSIPILRFDALSQPGQSGSPNVHFGSKPVVLAEIRAVLDQLVVQ